MKNLLLMFSCIVFAVSAADAANTPTTLVTAQEQVSAALAHLDIGLKKAAQELGNTGLAGDEARRILAAICGEFNYAVDCATIDSQGRMITVEPPQYRSFEGKDISGQEQVKRIRKTRKPVLSSVFRSVEGYDAADVEYPVFNPEGRFIGSISVLFKPEKFLGDIIKPLVNGVPMDIWAMEKGGRILFDVDPAQVGLNLLTSTEYRSYKQVVRLVKRIAITPQGDGAYRFKKTNLSGGDVNKKAYWQSVSLYGTPWRLVGIHLEQEATKEKAGRLVPDAAVEQALGKFAAETALKTALAAGNKEDGMKLFRYFHEATPGIYSVQWIDASGVNRYGFPAENSLFGYDYNSGRDLRDKEILQIVIKQQPAVFEAPLFEGRTGSFVFKPVFLDSTYLGMVYSIKIK
ncbi:MAG: cache domain-containing protein [Desulfofustis sp.]|nr:cache domain-containing protein [Desulfofustis sp.]